MNGKRWCGKVLTIGRKNARHQKRLRRKHPEIADPTGLSCVVCKRHNSGYGRNRTMLYMSVTRKQKQVHLPKNAILMKIHQQTRVKA